MPRFRLGQFEYTETDSSVLLRVRGEVIGADPDAVTESAVLVMRRSGAEFARVAPLRGSVSVSRSSEGARWAASFGVPRSAISGRRRAGFAVQRTTFPGRRRLTYELHAAGLEPVHMPAPTAIPRLEMIGTERAASRSVWARIAHRFRTRVLQLPERVRLPFLAGVAAAVAAAAALAVAPTSYSATARVVASPLASSDPALSGLPILLGRGDQSPTFLTAQTEAGAPSVSRRTAQLLGAGWTERKVAHAVTISAGTSPAVVLIVATAPNRGEAVRIAQTYETSWLEIRGAAANSAIATALVKARGRLQALGAATNTAAQNAALAVVELASLAGRGDPTLQPVGPPTVTPPRSLAKTALLILLSALCGVILGAFAGWVDRALGRRAVVTARRVISLTGTSILATLPPAESLVFPADSASGPVAQAIGGAFTLLEWGRSRPRSIALVSAEPGDGSTTAALALASYSAAQGNFVGLLDLDWLHLNALRRLKVRMRLGRAREPRTWFESVQRSSLGPTLLVSASLQPPDVAEVRDFIHRARAMAELVIVDTPPVTVAGDALTVVGLVDAVLLVVSLEKTSEPALRQMCDMLARTGVTPAGVLLFKPVGRPATYGANRRRRRQRDLWLPAGLIPGRLASTTSAGPSASSTQSR